MAATVMSPATANSQALFLKAIEKYNREVIVPAARKDREILKHTTLQGALEEIKLAEQKSAADGRTRRAFAKLQPALSALDHYAPILDTLLQAYPNPSCLIWGGIKLVLRVAGNYSRHFAELVQMLEVIGDSFPRLQAYEKLFSSERLNEIILRVYESMLGFLAIANKTFSTSGFKQLVKSMWTCLSEEFRTVVESLKKQTELADIEFGVLAVQKAEEERRLQSIERQKQEEEREKLASERQQQEIERREQVAERARTKSERDRLIERLERERRENEDQKRHEIMRWLSRSDTESAYTAARAKHAENSSSCAWIFKTSEYKSWYSPIDPIHSLWINAGPGTGKTILAGHIIHTIRDKCQQENSAVAYFFCNSRDGTKSDPLGPLRTLLCQLLDMLQHIPIPVMVEYSDQQRKGVELAHPERLHELLLHTLSLFRDAYIVVDGIDECEDRESLLSSLSALGRSSQETNIHVLVTSRAEPDICRSLAAFTNIKIHPADTKSDIREYIARSVRTIGGLDGAEEQLAIKDLSKKASGMFIWVRLVIDMLRDSASRQEFREALITMPRGLHQIYCLVIERIHRKITEAPQSRRELAKCTLRWMALATRPIRLPELCDALAVEISRHLAVKLRKGWENDMKSCRPSAQAILDICGTLVDLDDDAIRLLHHTAKDFLLGIPDHLRRSDIVQDYTASEDEGNMHIAEACLLYMMNVKGLHKGLRAFSGLSQHTFEAEDYRTQLKVRVRKEYPFYEYACRHWSVHFARCPVELNAFLLETFISFRLSEHSYLWCQSWALLHQHGRVPHSKQFRRLRKHGPALCSWLDFLDLMFRDIRQQNDIELETVANHSARAFRLLLENGTHVLAKDDSAVAVLRRATKKGKGAVVRLLLNLGADITAIDDSGVTPLDLAAQNGYEDVVRLLLDIGTNVQGKALLQAAQNGHEAIVRLLLDKGADIATEDDTGATALIRATQNGHEAVVRLLLDKGAYPQLDVLLQAAQNGHEAIIRLLLDGWTGPHGKALLHVAGNGHEATVQLLLDMGADFAAKSDSLGTALLWAVRNGHEVIAHVLLDMVADIAADNSVAAALVWAAQKGHKAVVRLLLDRGADVAAKDSTGATALIQATQNKHEAVVRLLLDRWADVAAKDGTGVTALTRATQNGHEAVVRLLLDRGFDVAVRGTYLMELVQAIRNGYGAIVLLVLEKRGVKAMTNERDTVMELLMKEGVCEYGFRWTKKDSHYHCEGGFHKISL